MSFIIKKIWKWEKVRYLSISHKAFLIVSGARRYWPTIIVNSVKIQKKESENQMMLQGWKRLRIIEEKGCRLRLQPYHILICSMMGRRFRINMAIMKLVRVRNKILRYRCTTYCQRPSMILTRRLITHESIITRNNNSFIESKLRR